MRHEDAYEWLEETPWWKKTIQWFGWLVLSLIAAAGFADAPLFALVGFGCVWCFRSVLTLNEWGIFGLFVAAVTIGGVSLFLIHIVAPEDQSFWYGFTLAAALLGAFIIFQLRKLKFTKETLQHEIYLTGFEWYRNQKLERDQKEYDEWLKKHPNQ
jgi:hypothetical protein